MVQRRPVGGDGDSGLFCGRHLRHADSGRFGRHVHEEAHAGKPETSVSPHAVKSSSVSHPRQVGPWPFTLVSEALPVSLVACEIPVPPRGRP